MSDNFSGGEVDIHRWNIVGKKGLRFMKKENHKKTFPKKKCEKEEKKRLEEKRNRKIDRGIRLGEIAVRILIWIFKD
ncbi:MULTISPECIES: hypothetical protein [Bacillus]|uniref:hypothetical protein n=1 Tax=Bacillus TaxID=1386 RepID=UPI0007723201|nr:MULTISPECIES: hypothetical protein [Bacillus]KXH80289.1 hypothetical protein AU379_23660 [Bacillus sp. JH7]